ncbi:lasso peptide biosynthesis B2 protein [Kibdelosporangium persicum]|uniref:lasso peptide biosynthesis B2 protein n=1 Tax=Kibdelosporangium persicum TaxID=2698649 RepID=UPI001563897B|nr:lasso peptide biosynthesis B2 protein [Kibdelosporangium persicum]
MPILPDADAKVSVADQVLVRAVVGVARLLAKRSPKKIAHVLRKLSANCRPATFEEARAARNSVLVVSTRCCGGNACLPRSLATVLLCRLRGSWAAWCVGVLAAPPFTAHAWVEADGMMVGEFADQTVYIKLTEVAA